MTEGLRIERLTESAEFDACVRVQQETWEYSAGEMFPRRAFLLAEKLGGHVLGVFDGEEMVAFNLAYPGYRQGLSYLHSQMLAVLPAYRNSGVGRALKLRQREIALAQGIALIEWTFDPLEIKNAFFNLQRLGAISRRYVRDFYGPSTSPLQGGLPTDRLYAEWWIGSERVENALCGALARHAEAGKIEVPADIYAWKQGRDPRAEQTQVRLRGELEDAFARGLVATGYRRNGQDDGAYLLTNDVFPRAGSGGA